MLVFSNTVKKKKKNHKGIKQTFSQETCLKSLRTELFLEQNCILKAQVRMVNPEIQKAYRERKKAKEGAS